MTRQLKMRHVPLGVLVVLLFAACTQKQPAVTSKADSIQTPETMTVLEDSVIMQEFFTDSTSIGRKGLNKVEVFSFRAEDSVFVDINFYTKKGKVWRLKQILHFLKDGISGCETKVTDFNNDQLNDMTIQSAMAARGGNEVRRLFIYDRLGDSLVEMKNSERYPNMLYNKELNCIDAFILTGGSETVFLHIRGDSLIEFASVDINGVLRVTETDKQGREKIIHTDTSYDHDYIRFKTYKPLQAYEDY